MKGGAYYFFRALDHHDELRARGVPELDQMTIFLKNVAEEKAVVEMLRLTAAGGKSSGGGSGAAGGAGGGG